MCGIFGWIKSTKDVKTKLDLTNIFIKGLLNTQERGTDATGYYSVGTGVVKDAIPAKDFVKNIVNINNERFVIGHCRAASYSSRLNIDDPKNAHPFESQNLILVHNGTVKMNYLKNYNYTSDVDSESILAYAETTSLRNALASINGGSTVVLYSKTQKKFYFWTDGNKPLTLAYFDNIIFFASTKKILIKTLGVKNTLGIFPNISFATIYERELLEFDLVKNKFTRKGIIEEKETKPTIIDESDDGLMDFSQENKSIVVYDHNYRPNTNYKPSSRQLPKGCGSNPNNSKIIRIGTNGSKIIQNKNS